MEPRETGPRTAGGYGRIVAAKFLDWTDLGGFMKVPLDKVQSMLDKIQRLLGEEDDLHYFIDSWQDLLNFEFPLPPSIMTSHDRILPPSSHKLVKMEKTSIFLKNSQLALGAQLIANGTIDNYKLERSHFPLIKTANPLLATISSMELTHVIDVGYWFTFHHFGVVNVDLVWRQHIGGQIRALFPNFPDRGARGSNNFVAGKDRDPVSMLRWRFSNPRKSMSKTIGYKGKQTMARAGETCAPLPSR